jgi:hypothetical protein
MKPTGISAAEAHQDVTSGKALLVCAYQDEDACRKVHLEGAISLIQFESKLSGLPKDQEIIFFVLDPMTVPLSVRQRTISAKGMAMRCSWMEE